MKQEVNIALYTVTHNQSIKNISQNEIPIQVGAALNPQKLCKVTDDTGDNISLKNRQYCELTALYWIWKNDNHTIIGLNHYRRKFVISLDMIQEKLFSADVIVPKPYYFRKSLEKEYARAHMSNDWIELEKILRLRYSDEIIKHVFSSNKLYPYNMFIAQKPFVNEYCEWLFPLLFELEGKIDFRNKDAYQSRIFGFLSERLFTLFLTLKKVSIYECSVTIPEKSNMFKSIKYAAGIWFNRLYFSIRN